MGNSDGIDVVECSWSDIKEELQKVIAVIIILFSLQFI